jgi:hypothetical protein
VSTFSKTVAAPKAEAPGKRPPTTTKTIPLKAYADTWKQRPTTAPTVGIRQLAERDYEVGAKTAMEDAWKAFPDDAGRREEAFVNGLMRWVVARGLCKADDASAPAFSSHDEYVFGAFTPDGLKLLFQWVEDHKIEESCLGREVDAGDFAVLARLVSSPIVVDRLLRTMTPREKRRLMHSIDEMKRETGDLMSFANDEKYPVIEGDDDDAPAHPTH